MRANTYIREVEPRFKKSKQQDSVKICRSKDAYELFKDMQDHVQEKLIALHLAGNNTVVCFQIVHIGTINNADLNPADIMRTALLTGAVSLIIIHNHPSGNSEPSVSDKKSLSIIKKAAQLFQLRVFDFIIIGKNKYYSAADEEEI